MHITHFSDKARKIIARIRALNIPQRAKADLLLLWSCSSRLVEKIIAFIKRHTHLTECLVLGAIVAFLVGQVPFIGGFFALMTLVTAPAVGLMSELQRELETVFA